MGVFRGLGYTSPSLAAYVLAPTPSSSSVVAAVQSSSEWPPKKPRGRRKKQRKKEPRGGGDHQHRLLQLNCVVVNPSDMWCAIDSSVDCISPSLFHHSRPDRPNPPIEDLPTQCCLPKTRRKLKGCSRLISHNSSFKSYQVSCTLELFRGAPVVDDTVS